MENVHPFTGAVRLEDVIKPTLALESRVLQCAEVCQRGQLIALLFLPIRVRARGMLSVVIP